MKKKILVIDDDQKLNHLLSDYLSKFGYTVTACTHPHEGLKALKREMPDLIILDIMLPDMDGFEVCKQIRRDYSVPIIMLTARGEVTDRIVGLGSRRPRRVLREPVAADAGPGRPGSTRNAPRLPG